MDLLVTINNNISDENTNDSIASTATTTTSSLPSSLRGNNKIYEKITSFDSRKEAEDYLRKMPLDYY